MLLLGYDIGSSSVKATALDAETGAVLASATSPQDAEMTMIAEQPGWAEQHPETWWEHVQAATALLRRTLDLDAVGAIGLAYQMHGLVLVDEDYEVLRPSIIWCDSRAVPFGEEAFAALGEDYCRRHLLNSPGNFTASKLAWVREHEPELFDRIHRAMLPGDYIALRMTGEATTTVPGLSEGILWDVDREALPGPLLDHFGIPASVFPRIVPTFAEQGHLTRGAAATLGLPPGVPVAYRAGDQPNNAFSLRVLRPGQLAATAGTSGVVYGVGDAPVYDDEARVNTFVHVTHQPEQPRYGTLLCVNGTGILYRWLREHAADGTDYAAMNEAAARVPVGAEGLVVLPYGNGAERSLGNRDLGAAVHHLRFNTHGRAHLFRAAQEGIAFALRHGVDAMRDLGLTVDTIRAGHANLFLSPVFAEAFATTIGATVELYDTDGAQGAARGAGVGIGHFDAPEDAYCGLRAREVIDPATEHADAYAEAYDRWADALHRHLNP
jgi:xylulokinase